MTAAPEFIENRTFDELRAGDQAQLLRCLGTDDIKPFASVSGDLDPAQLGAEFAGHDVFQRIVASGTWGGALIWAVLATELPGPGTIYVSQSLNFLMPARPGDMITAQVRIKEKHPGRRVILDCSCTNQAGEIVIAGTAEVIAPDRKVHYPRHLVSPLRRPVLGHHHRLLMERARGFPPIRTAVVHPCDGLSLVSAIEARNGGLIVPILVGPRSKIEAAAAETGIALDGVEIIDTPHSHAAADEAVRLARAGQVDALLKGALHTDELMGAAVSSNTGLRTERRVSHVFAFDVPAYPKPLFITDAAVNIEPVLDDKRDIVQNAIDLCRAFGIAPPKVAILAAVETVSAKMSSTVDAAALCKMAERGQILGGILDGPLAFDNAISKEAAATKHIASNVAGDVDILVAPNLEAGNMLAKQLIYLAGADAAGLDLGTRVPVMLTSRSDTAIARLASCALAQIFVHNRKAATP